MWSDPGFRSLSKDAQLLNLYLLTGPHTTALPGAFIAGEAGMAESLSWPVKAFRRALSQLSDRGIVHADWQNRLVFLPSALNDNLPESPNVVRAWRKSFLEFPECDLKSEIRDSVRAVLEGLRGAKKEAFLEAFSEDFSEPFAESVSGTGRVARKEAEALPRSAADKLRAIEESINRQEEGQLLCKSNTVLLVGSSTSSKSSTAKIRMTFAAPNTLSGLRALLRNNLMTFMAGSLRRANSFRRYPKSSTSHGTLVSLHKKGRSPIMFGMIPNA
jgi:hypothetical protein